LPSASIDTLRKRARRRVPRIFFDYADGGATRETALALNSSRLAEIRMLPRAPRNVSKRDVGVDLFGNHYAMPLGIAPIGLANLFWPGADAAMAKAARNAGIPHVLSTAASTTIEEIGEISEGTGWYQLYASSDERVTESLLTRAEAAGYEVLVLTIDVALPGRRWRDLRNGFKLPMPFGPAFISQLATCPAWLRASIGRPVPKIVNLEQYAPSGGAQSLAQFMASQISSSIDLAAVAKVRDRWKGPLVVKGVLHPQDAIDLSNAGVDGVIVSNHGGRQLDSAPASIDALRLVAEAVGNKVTVMMDGGIRTGEDIAVALASGAQFVFAGRPFLYSVAATGDASPAVEILRDEFDRALGQLGCCSATELSTDYLFPEF